MEDPEKIEYIDKSLKEIDRIDGILRKLLDAAKRPKFEIGEVWLDRIIDSTLEVFKPQIEHHKIKVVRDYRRVPPAIQADALEMEQVFANLFLNAIHEMPCKGMLTVQLDHDDSKIVIRVSDTGKGIPRENIPNIFDPFFSTKSCGIGMGWPWSCASSRPTTARSRWKRATKTGTTFCHLSFLLSPLSFSVRFLLFFWRSFLYYDIHPGC